MSGYTKQYRANRRIVLEGSPVCAMCHRRKATTVDHIVPLAQGGGDELSNLRPACAKCNYSAGAKLGNQMRTTQRKRRAAGMIEDAAKAERPDEAEPFFPADTGPRAAPIPSLSRNEHIEDGPATFGRTEPRLWTPRTGYPTWGAEAAETYAAILHRELWPWQKLALDGMLAHRDTTLGPELASPIALTTVARQQGKTEVMKALILWALLRWPAHRGEPVTVLSAAHTMKLAESIFRPLIPTLKDILGATVYTSAGRLEAHFPNGSQWHVVASNTSAGHGFSPALVCLDEIWRISDEVISNGFLPAQRAQRSPLLAMFSTAGDSNSAAFLRYRQAALQAVQNGTLDIYLNEWSPPEGNLEDPELWLYANPSIGHNPALTLDGLEQRARTSSRAEFLRSYLNVWVASAQGWLDVGVWQAAQVDVDLPPASWVAIDSSPDESRYSAVAAHRLEDGTVVLTVPFSVSTEAELWRHLLEWMPATCWLAVTPTLELHTPHSLRRRTRRVGYGEIASWTSEVRSAITEGRVRHTGDAALADHMSRAVAQRTERGISLSSKASAGPIELARCSVWASWLAMAPPSGSKPMIAVGRR